MALSVGPNPCRERAHIRFKGIDSPRRVSVLDIAGRLVRSIDLPRRSGAVESSWDLRDALGHRVAAGLYVIRVDGRAKDGALLESHRPVLVLQ
jgi:hypothetical protein